MALDGILLSKIKEEIISGACGAKLEKIQQTGKDEILLTLRAKTGVKKLFISVSANAARICFVEKAPEAPANPPMFCMLLRKHLSGATLVSARQLETDRVLFLDFSAFNEIGDRVVLTLCVEIMAKCSNIILFDSSNTIIDSIKRVDVSVSSVRQILPKLQYAAPPKQNKLGILEHSEDELIKDILLKKNHYLSRAVIDSVQGISPVISREIAFLVTSYDEYVCDLTESQVERLSGALRLLRECASSQGALYMVSDKNGKPKDISFMPVRQYGSEYTVSVFDSPSRMLEAFYSERDRIDRTSHRSRELVRQVNTVIDRIIRKTAAQRSELEGCKNKDDLRLYGELIINNSFSLSKGCGIYRVENYYDDMKTIDIPVDPALTPVENANRYYKSYQKAKTAEVMLKKLIEDGENERVYLESVLDELSRAESDSELASIRLELSDGGYVKNKFSKKKKPPKELPPIEFLSDDGFRILVGRNNVQNDRLSMRIASANDMWLHVQGFPGSHVIIFSKDGEVSDLSIEQAAAVAACFSKASDGTLVPVDYTPVRFLKKPNGARPGKVIYHQYYTVTVKPDRDLAERLRVK